MTNGRARSSGAGIFLGGSGGATLTIKSCPKDIQFYESNDVGGFIYVENPSTQISSNNCNYKNLNAKTRGGLIYVKYDAIINIQNSQMMNVTAGLSGSILNSPLSNLYLTLSSISVSCAQSYSPFLAKDRIEFQTNFKTNLFRLEGGSVTSSNNVFQNC